MHQKSTCTTHAAQVPGALRTTSPRSSLMSFAGAVGNLHLQPVGGRLLTVGSPQASRTTRKRCIRMPHRPADGVPTGPFARTGTRMNAPSCANCTGALSGDPAGAIARFLLHVRGRSRRLRTSRTSAARVGVPRAGIRGLGGARRGRDCVLRCLGPATTVAWPPSPQGDRGRVTAWRPAIRGAELDSNPHPTHPTPLAPPSPPFLPRLPRAY